MRSVLLSVLIWGPGFLTSAHAQVKNPGTFVYAIVGDIDSLDPDWQYDGISQTVMWQTYETLIFYKGSSVSEAEPLLATTVPTKANSLISRDGLTYTFPIRRGVKFHDGTQLTAEDARYSVLRFLLTDRAGGPSSLLLEPILGAASTRGPDGKPLPELYELADQAVREEGGALVIHLKQPFAPFLSILSSFCPIVSKSWVAAHGGWDGTAETWTRFNNPAKESSFLYDHINGTGPFSLDRWDKKEKQLVLIRNARYWRAPAKLDRLIFKTVDEFATRKLLLAAGDADAAFVERQFLPQVSDLPGITVEDDLPFFEVHNAFVFNYKTNPAGNPYIGSGRLDGEGVPQDFFSDLEVRRGFAHAFDYDAYIRDGYRGKGNRARGPIPAGIPGYNYNEPLISYDLAEATDHFRKAFDGKVWEKGFQLTVTYEQGRADRQLACQILKKGVESVNPRFKIDVRGIQWSTYLDASQAGKFPLINARWAMDYPDPHNCVQPFLHSQGYYAKMTGYSNPRADQMVDDALRELDPDKRRTMYYELQRIAYFDLPDIFTVDTFNLRVRRSWVQGWDYNPILMYGYFYPVSKEE